MNPDLQDESIFIMLHVDLREGHIKYAVNVTIQAIEYAMTTRHGPSLNKCSGADRKTLGAFIPKIIEAFDYHRRMAMIIVALIYIERAKNSLRVAGQTNICCAVFLSSLMLATKFTGEKHISNRAWRYYSRITSQKALNKAERALFYTLDYDLSITDAQVLYHLNAMHSYGRPWINGKFPSARFSSCHVSDEEND